MNRVSTIKYTTTLSGAESNQIIFEPFSLFMQESFLIPKD